MIVTADIETEKSTETNPQTNLRWATVVGAVTLLVTLIPYLIGWSYSAYRHFMWLGYNLDDSCVYLSWMRQAADGSHRALNLFTTEAQHGLALNPFFLLLGATAHALHLPLLFVLHAARIIFGGCLLAVIWKLIVRCTSDSRSQRLAFLFVCFGSGLGWMSGFQPGGPIDAWQPEAVTFLALYLSPLFCFSLMLQALSALFFLSAIDSSKVKYAVYSGLAVCLLGLTHTYDVITMIAVFGSFAFALTLSRKDGSLSKPWLFTGIVGILALPSVLYIYRELQTENIFHKRMEVRTASGPLHNVMLGYGLLILLAAYAGFITINSIASRRKSAASPAMQSSVDSVEATAKSTSRSGQMMLIAWMIANIAVAYLPLTTFPFQRKMLQGAHIPIAILAGFGAAAIASRMRGLRAAFRFNVATTLFTFILSISNIMFMMRDVDSFKNGLIQTTRMHRPYINSGEMDALEWLHSNTPAGTPIQPLPWLQFDGAHFAPVDVTLACFTPGLIDRPVYCGHWGETPDYKAKLAELARFGLPAPHMTDDMRIEMLRRTQVKYLVFSQKQSDDSPNPDDRMLGEAADKLAPMFRGYLPIPPYLIKVYTNTDADIYKVQLP